MDGPFNPLAFPVVLSAPDWLPPHTLADGRLPFARLVVALLEPAQVVELGVGRGETYTALCQAVQAQRLTSQCLGVELKDPPEAAGEQTEAVAEFRAHHAAHYGGFSRLLAAEARGSAAYFSDGSVDLLHLASGLNSAEAAEAFRQWLPKLSARAAVLVSHIHPAEGARGLAAFWAETRPNYAHLELQQGQGMGLLLVGVEPPAALAQLTCLPAEQQAALRELLHRLGQAAVAPADSADVAALQQTLREQTEHLDQLQGRLEIVTAREREIRGLYLDLHQQLVTRDQIAGDVVEKDHIIAVRDGAVAVRDALILEHERNLAARDALLLEHERNLAARDALLLERQHTIAARDEALTALRVELALAQAEIRTIHAGRIWRLSTSYWQIRYRLAALFREPTTRAH